LHFANGAPLRAAISGVAAGRERVVIATRRIRLADEKRKVGCMRARFAAAVVAVAAAAATDT